MNSRWNDFKNDAKVKDIVCYGAGVNAVLMLMNDKFSEFLPRVRFFIDKDPSRKGTFIKNGNSQFEIYGIDALDNIGSDCIVVVTITDYLSTGKMLDEKKIRWYPWTIISTDFSFEGLETADDDGSNRIFLLNTPDYINLGDQAIAFAEEIYLKRNFGKFYEFGTHACHPEALTKLRKYVHKNDVIMFQGGGNLGSLWRVCEEIFRDVLKKFPDNTIIVFPQSVYYGDSDEERRYFLQSCELYNTHKNLLICVRDKRSYNFVTESYKCRCMLLPDMVLTLNGIIAEKKKRCNVGILLRNDKEQYLENEYHDIIRKAALSTGCDVITITHHPTEAAVTREERIKHIFSQYSSCSLVITDRLHGMIFAAVTNTPCIAFDNSYHKVSDVYKTWLSGLSSITFTKAVGEQELLKLVQEKLNTLYEPYDEQQFVKKFDRLTEFINNKIKK